MNKKLSRIYLLATFTVVLFSTQNLLAESIVLFSRDFTDGSLSPFTPEGNWQISNGYGQPAPGAQYNWSPTQTDYSHSLISPVLDGSSVNDSVAFTYDLWLNNYSSATLEEFAVEIKIDTTWIAIATYDNTAGSIAWGSHVHYVSEYFPTSEEVQIRFRAHGPNSYNINYWVIDNIKLEGIQDSTPPDTPTNFSASPDDEQVTLAWSPNTENDLALYRIYRGSSSPASTLIDSVTANSDQDTSYVDLNVSNGELYYYRITAVDLTGNESDYTDEISITPYDPEIGQAIELLINNSESTVSGSNSGYPINTWYHDVRHQSLYLASELADAGIAPGASINGIQLRIFQQPGRDIDSLRIGIVQTSNTSLASAFETVQIVHGPTNYVQGDFVPESWYQFVFSSALIWDGNSNIIVEYSHDNSAYVSGGGVYMRSTTPDYRGRKGWTDSGAGHYPFTSGNMPQAPDNKVASIKLVLQEAAVQAPTELVATPSYQTVDLSWTASITLNIANYMIYRGTSSDILTLIDSTASTSTVYNDTSLTNGTTYYYSVKAKTQNAELSANSSIVSAIPSVETPANLAGTAGSQQVSLSWDSPSGDGVARALVYQGLNATGSNSLLVDSTSSSTDSTITITGLDNETTYYFAVKFRGNDNTTSSFSDVISATPGYFGPVWLVDADNGSSNGEGSLGDPLLYIRDAIEAAADGDTIMLMPGTYDHSKNRNLNFQYQNDVIENGVKNLTLKSQYGADSTIINLQGNDFIDINSGETDSRIEGLTIQNSSSGAITVWWNSSVEINNCIFLNNSNGDDSDGGAIDIQETNDRVTISNTLFKGNSSSSRGGAIFIGMNGTDVAVVNCIFDGNTADEAGGAISQDNNTNLLVVHSLFIDNTSNSDSWAGGVNSFAGMYGGSTTIINSIFTGNTDNSGSSNSDINTSGYSMDIDHCVLQSESNEVFDYGDNYVLNEDYILNDPENGDYSLMEASPAIGLGLTEFYDNISEENVLLGDWLLVDYLGQSRIQPAGSNPDLGAIENELASSPYPDPPKNFVATSKHQSVGLSWSMPDSTDVIRYYVYMGTDSTSLLPADTIEGRIDTSVTITSLTNNQKYYFNITSEDNDTPAHESIPSDMVSAIPDYTGPAWYVSSSGNNNTGDGSSTAPFATIQYAINEAAENDTIKLKPGTFTGYGNNNIIPQKDLVIMGIGGADSVTIDVNASFNNRYYGFHFYDYDYSSMKIKGLTIINAVSTDGNGGAIRINGAGSIDIEDCVIGPGNKASRGAGIWINDTDVNVSGTTIKGNTAPMTSGYFPNNNVYGVGLYINSGNSNTVNITNCLIRGNSGTASGNQNDMYGGGFYAGGSSTTNFINTFIYNNDLSRSGTQGWWSRGGGGAVANGAQVNFVHTNILNNNAENTSSATDGRGGALWLNGSNDASVYFLNSIIWGNTASTSDASEQMFASENSPYVAMNYSASQVTTSGTGNFNEDPKFEDEENNNYALSLRSGLLGMGATTAMTSIPGASLIPDTDYLGNARPGSGGGNPDIGAIENDLSDSPVPDAPSGLTATAGDGQVALSWTASSDSDVSEYGIYYGTSSGPSVKQEEVSNDTSLTVTGLSNNIIYYFRITAIDSNDYESTYSSEISATPQFSGETIYVNGSATGSEDGSQSNPYHTLQEAISAETTTNGKRILVLAGTYIYDSGSGGEITYSFSYDDGYGNQNGSFTVINGNPSSLSFTHSDQNTYPGSDWTINASASHFNSVNDFEIEASNTSSTFFHLDNSSVDIWNLNGSGQGGGNIQVNEESGSTSVIALEGKNITLEAVNGPDSTFIDGGGQYPALVMDAYEEAYEGYASSTEFIGFTFKNSPDDEPLIVIIGPGTNSSLDWAPTFTNCRFIDSEITSGNPAFAPVLILFAEPTFDGCVFRNLHVEAHSNYNYNDIYGPIRIHAFQGIEGAFQNGSNWDTTAFRPQFKNCVIAGNSLKRGDFNGNQISLNGGAVAVGFGAIPYFENTRIDSNTVDIESGRYGNRDAGFGGGIFISNYLSRGEYIRFVNCSISGNSVIADEIYGGGMHAAYPAVSLVNTIMVNNKLDGQYADNSDWSNAQGGAIHYSTDINDYENGNPDEDPELRIVNSTIADNSITNISENFDNVGGAGICRNGTENHNTTIFNSIIYGNEIEGYLESQNNRINLSSYTSPFGDNGAHINYSILEFFEETGLDEDDLMDTDPNFVGSGNYTLSNASVAIGAGIDEYEDIDAPAFDYNNSVRPNPDGSEPDLGAFESSLSTTPYPATPQSLVVDLEADSSITLSWTANSEDDLSEYRIYYGTSSATALLDSVSGTNSYTATGLDNYTTYYFAVSAMDLDGYESSKSNEVSGEPKWSGPIWYVDWNQSSGSGKDGSPATPFRELQDAIDMIAAGDTIIVLPGTYNRNDDTELSFLDDSYQPKNLVLQSRDGAATTILDGEDKRVFDISDGTDTTLQIIGFTITASDGGEDDADGSVIKIHGDSYNNNNQQIIEYSGVTFKNCIIKDINGEDSPIEVIYGKAIFNDCEISGNTFNADDYDEDAIGGAIRIGGPYSYGSSIVHFYRSKLDNNTVTADQPKYVHGGAIGIGGDDHDVKLVNTIVAGNSINFNSSNNSYPIGGGGIKLRGGNLLLINCTIADNQVNGAVSWSDQSGSAIHVEDYNEDDDPTKLTIFNSIIYGNTTITNTSSSSVTDHNDQIYINDEWNDGAEIYASYSLFGGDDDLDGDEILLNTFPDFTDTTYVLHERSPAIGKGATESVDVEDETIYAPSNDLAGNARPGSGGGDPDLGAYEHDLAVTPYPAPLENLTATPLHQSVLLEWDLHGENNVDSYIAYISEDSITFTAVDTVTSRFTVNITIDNLTNDEDYWFYVTAVNTSDYESLPSFHTKTTPFYQGPVWYVDTDNGSSSGDGSSGEPVREIQDAIDIAAAGDTVLVLPGTYDRADDQELYFKYTSGVNDGDPKNIVLKSRDGAAVTILDGEGNKSLFEITDETDTTLQIIGFTIYNGGGDGEYNSSGSAVQILGGGGGPSGVTFRNCIFTETTSENPVIYGGDANVRFFDCEIKNNTVSNNSWTYPVIYFGSECNVFINRCKITDNTTIAGDWAYGGAMFFKGDGGITNVKVINSIIANNSALVENSPGSPALGGAFCIDWGGVNVTVINCTIVGNTADNDDGDNESGGVASIISNNNPSNFTVLNSIMTDNYPGNNPFNYDNNTELRVSYSFITGIDDVGDYEDGVYNFEPDFLDSTSYALHPRSRAIGAGEVEEEDAEGNEIFAPTIDLLGNARPNPADSNPDLGAYEHELAVTAYPAIVEDVTATPFHLSIQVEWDYHEEDDVTSYITYMSENENSTFIAMDTVEGRFNTRTTIENLTNGEDYWFYVTAVDTAGYESSPTLFEQTSPFFQGPVWIVDEANGSSNAEGSPEEPLTQIQDAIDLTAAGDTVLVLPGTYDSADDQDIEFAHNIVLMSRGGPDSTVIDCEGNSRAFLIDNLSDTTLKIIGFNIVNGGEDYTGQADNNGGSAISIYGVNYWIDGQDVILYSSVIFENCIIEDGDANTSAVFIYNGVGIFRDCIIRNNRNYYPGTNSGWVEGGGFSVRGNPGSALYLDRCKVVSNNVDNSGNDVVTQGAGIAVGQECTARIRNSLIADNYFTGFNSWSRAAGISVDNSKLTLINTTITGNVGFINTLGSGLNLANYYVDPETEVIILNSIVAGNTPNFLQLDFDGDHTDYLEMTHSIFEGSTGSSWFDPDEHYDIDPLFEDSIAYALNEFSPAIGLGGTEIEDAEGEDIFAPSVDILGNLRPNPEGSKPDIGAYEHERWEQRRKVLYVDVSGSDSNDGLSAGAPLLTLGEAFNKSVVRDTIELASGTYNGAGNRDLDFNGVDRIIRSTDGAAATIIDCEIMGQAFILENGETDSTIISGITIQNGAADNGGAVYIDGADPIFENVIFGNNSATTSGGAVYASDSHSEFVNCVFVGNHAAESGAFSSSESNVTLNFITAVGNHGDDDISFSGAVSISNSILWGNSPIDDEADVTYSDVMGGSNDGEGNYNGRPGFIDGLDGNFHLQDWSPVIGQASAASAVVYDIEGNARSDSIPDMGAYENALDAATTYAKQNFYVSTSGSDSVTATMGTEENPFETIQHALNHAIYDDEVHISAGTYNESLNNWGKDILIVGSGDHPENDVNIDGFFEITGGSPTLYDLHLTNNNGTDDVLQINNDAVVTLYNLLITDSEYSGVTINNTAVVYMYNMTIYGNWTGVYENSLGSVFVLNSILWNNTTSMYGLPAITYSNVEGGQSGVGNINADPVFVDTLSGDFNLQINSPCIDTGNPLTEYDADSTVVDMGAFPLIRELLAGTSTENVDITEDEPVVFTEDYTLAEDDTLFIESGSDLYFEPGVTLIIDGVMAASGEAGEPISFQSSDPDSTYGGVIVNTGSGGRTEDVYSYMVIQDVEAAVIPLIINGDATLAHITIAGNDNSTSLEVNNGTVTLNYSILEGGTSGSGTINNVGSVTNNTGQFVDYDGGDFTLLSTASAIDLDTTEFYIDPDFTFADAGCYYHDQTDYASDSASVLYPAVGDTISVNPDTSSTVGAGLLVEAQIFNTIGHYMTNPSIQWGNAFGNQQGTFDIDTTYGADLRGRVSNTYYSTTTTGDINSITVDENSGDPTTAQGGYFKIFPGAPDSVWVNEQTDMYMTQSDELSFSANIYDQFANLVSDGEIVTLSIIVVTGNGDGFTLSESTSSTSIGSVSVTLATDPTGNSLSVGDQVRVQAVSGNGVHQSALVTIIPDDIYNLTMPSELTAAQIDLSADIASIEIEAAMIDTFDNPLAGVEVNWGVVTGNNTGESLSAASTFTDASGVANVTLNTSTAAGSDYQVRGWVTDNALLSVLMGNQGRDQNAVAVPGTNHNQQSGKNGLGLLNSRSETSLVSLPVRIVNNTSTENNTNRNVRSIYDLDDTTAVIHVIPGASDLFVFDLANDTVMTQYESLNISITVYDQNNNLVSDGTNIDWAIQPASAGISLDLGASSTTDGITTNIINTNPSAVLGNTVTIEVTSGSASMVSNTITIVPDDPFDLTITDTYERNPEADQNTVPLEVTIIDTFDNALEGVPVFWSIVEGADGYLENTLLQDTTSTNVSGIATNVLTTDVTAGAFYRVRVWVDNTASLNDTTEVITVLPGAPTTIIADIPDTMYVVQGQIDTLEIQVMDQFENYVSDGSVVNWNYSGTADWTTSEEDNSTTNGLASIIVAADNEAPWLSQIDFNIEVESVFNNNTANDTVIYRVEDVIAPAAVSDLAISPNVWTSVNDFTLTWSNPSEHSGVAGAHYSIDGSGDNYVESQNISTLTGLTLPANALSTYEVWLEDNASNVDVGTNQSIIAKWDDTPPAAFNVTAPITAWYNSVFLRFEWEASSDVTAGLQYYELDINEGSIYQQHPDSTGMNYPEGFAVGTHNWTISAYDSANNETVTSNPQTFYVDYLVPEIAHNPVLEASENSPVTITATFTDDESGIEEAKLYYRKGGEVQWQAPVDMSTLNTYQIASSFVTSVGVEYYIYSRDIAGNETYKPDLGHYSISVTIPGAGLSSTDRWPTGVPNGSAVSSYQLLSFPGQAANNTPTDILVDDLLVYDDTKWRFFTYSGSGWNEFATISNIDPGVGYFLIVKDAGLNITTGQTRTVATDVDFTINFTSSEWVMLGNPFDFNIPLENVLINDSTSLTGDPNFYTYDGGNGWVAANSLEPWKGYVYKSATANQLYIKPSKSSGGLKISNPEIVLLENEWLIDISARNGLGVDKLNTVGVLTNAYDEYDALDAFEPPMLPGGISLRMDNRGWSQYGDLYTTDIRTVKEDGEYWDMEVAAEDDRHNVYLNFENIDHIPADFDVYIIDITLGVAQDLRWNPVYRYAVSSPESLHEIRFIAGTREFVNANNAGVELYPDRFSISQNFPNPFNPQTSILITLEDMATVDLIIYNLLGEEVLRIADNTLYPTGYHNFTWRGVNHDGKRVASGVYFYSTRIRDISGKTILNKTNKMIMVK